MKSGAKHPFLPRRELRGQLDVFSAEDKAELFGLACPPEEDTARQEFKGEADTATILSRYGAGAQFTMQSSGVVDFTASLQDSIHAVRETEAAYARLPVDLRKRYGSWRAVAEAIARGELKAPEPPGGGSPGGKEASPSDSAAEKAPKGA